MLVDIPDVFVLFVLILPKCCKCFACVVELKLEMLPGCFRAAAAAAPSSVWRQVSYLPHYLRVVSVWDLFREIWTSL